MRLKFFPDLQHHLHGFARVYALPVDPGQLFQGNQVRDERPGIDLSPGPSRARSRLGFPKI